MFLWIIRRVAVRIQTPCAKSTGVAHGKAMAPALASAWVQLFYWSLIVPWLE